MGGVTLGRRGVWTGLVLFIAMAVFAPAVLAATKTISVTSSAFPATTTVRVGDTVTWSNSSNIVHDVTANNGSFDTGYFDDGESVSVKFTKAGSYPYYCTLHSGMTGRIVVRAASGGSGGVPAAPATDVATDDHDATAAILALLGVVMLAATVATNRRFAPVRVRSDDREDR